MSDEGVPGPTSDEAALSPPSDGAVPSPTSDGVKRAKARRTRLVISVVLLALTLLATPLFVVALWANTALTNTDRYVKTVAPLADDPQVQEYVAGELAAAFTSNVDLNALLAEQLPPALQPLTGTIASAVNGFVDAAANRFTASPAFKTIWVQANRAAHTAIVRVLTGDSDALDLNDGALTIDLGDAVRRFQTRLVDEGFALAGRIDLSGVDRQVVLADGKAVADIEQARKAIGLLNDLVWVLGVLALVTAVASVVVAPNKGAALKRLGIGLALVVVVVAVVLGLTRRAVISAAGQVVPAGVATSFFDSLVDSMRFAFRLVFVLGLVMAVLTIIVSLPTYTVRWARPTQIGVALLGVAALLAANNITWGLILLVVVLVVVTEVILEVSHRRGLQEGAQVALVNGG